jgi:hypothetical protein
MYETMEDLACQFHIVLNILWPWSSLASFKSTLSIYDLSVNVEQENMLFPYTNVQTKYNIWVNYLISGYFLHVSDIFLFQRLW